MTWNQYSLSLNGTNQYSYVADNAALSGLSDISIEAWIKIDQLPSTKGSNVMIVSKYDWGNTDREYELGWRSTTDKLSLFYSDDGSSYTEIRSATTFTSTHVGKWVHIAVACDTSAQTANYYINGVEEAGSTTSSNATSIRDGTSRFAIGSENSGVTPAAFYGGELSNVRLWSDIRTESEIQDNMFSILTGTSNNLVGSWYNTNDHNDDGGTNNLTASGSPVFSTNVPWTGANSTDWTQYQIQTDNTKVSGSADHTDIPLLISDGNLSSAVYSGLNGSKYSGIFDGSTDAVNISDHSDLKPTGDFTVGAWFKTSSTGTTRGIIASTSQNTNVAGWRLRVEGSGNKLELLTGKNTGTTNNVDYETITGSTTVTDGEWHFGVATWDGSNLNLYLDGVSDASAVSWANAPGYAATNYVDIGSYRLTGTNIANFSGNIDQAFIINGTAWSANDVANYYGKNIASVSATNLVAFYDLDNNLTDTSGSTNTHNGTDVATLTYSSTDIAKLLKAPDLRFTTDTAGTTEVPYEIVSLDKVSETSEIWIKYPTLSYNTNSDLYVWYGNSSAVPYDANAPFGSQAVWSDYQGVWHLGETVNTTSGGYKDSTGNSAGGTGVSMSESAVAGKAGNAQSFDGTADYINVGTGYENGTGDFSIQGWYYGDADGVTEDIAWKYDLSTATYPFWAIYKDSTNVFYFSIRDALGDGADQSDAIGTTTVSAGSWYMFHAKRGSDAFVHVFTNGANKISGSDSATGSVNSSDPLTLGAYPRAGRYGDEKLDEFRVRFDALADDWIATEYNNQNDPSTFWKAGGVRRYFSPGIWRVV